MTTPAHRAMMPSLAALTVVGAALLSLAVGGCPPADNAGGKTETVRETIAAAVGGTLQTESGVSLQIPAGALPADTEITLTTVSSDDLGGIDSSFLAGVVLEPDGLKLGSAATLRVPLPAALDTSAPPRELVFKGTSPDDAVETGDLVQLSADGLTAIFSVTHFSGRICANNCHEGVREYLTSVFAAKGCPQAEWQARVVGKYPGLVFEPCETINANVLQCILDSFFDFHVGADAGVDISADQLAELEQIAASGRQVVVIFGKDKITPRGGPRNFYGNVAHSTIVEFKDGKWQLRNAFVPGNVPLAALGGTNLVWWPLADLNTFRNLKQGVGIEMAVCGVPGCLGSDDPDLIATKPYNPLETRIVPWNAVRIYVEREENEPCNRLAGCWQFDTPDSDGSGSFLLRFDEFGQVDSLAASGLGQATAEHAASEIFIELFRFARANSQALLPLVERVTEGVDLSDDQSSFSSDFEISLIGRDDAGAIRSRVEYFFKLSGATLSKNEPSEFFDATWELRLRVMVTNDEGEQTTEENTTTATIRAHRVPCPTTADGTLIPQEAWNTDAAFGPDFDLNVCGSGTAATTPLLLTMMLVGVGCRRGYRSAKRASASRNRG